MAKRKKPAEAPAVARMLDMFEYAVNKGSEIGVNEIARELDISPNLAFRILKELEKKHYARKTDESKYTFTLKFFALANRLVDKNTIRKIAYPYLSDLAERANETTLLAAFEHDALLLIDEIVSDANVNIALRKGAEYPAHSIAPGVAALAFVDRKRLSQFIKNAKRERGLGASEVDQFEKRLSRARSAGYDVEREQFLKGCATIGVPIFYSDGSVAGSLGTIMPVGRLKEYYLSNFVGFFKDAAQKISRELGANAKLLKERLKL